ncbi:MAG TPA: ribbon-helix-helix protein, CopG family [Anaerolineales bacterium]|nr:ribbon-helix-helix protein, CopG family [Anaerolineales bacterium]
MDSIREAPKSRRLNILVSESLIESLTATAKSRGLTVSAVVRQAVESECRRSHEEALARVAEALAPLYKTDKELTAFQALDGEEFR